MTEDTALKVLFLGGGNSCCSQMAEAFARDRKAGQVEPHSAGIKVCGVNVLAVAAMAEVGIDISGCRAKGVGAFADVVFDYVVTLGQDAREQCPGFTSPTQVVHWDIDAPPDGPTIDVMDARGLEAYRRVRDRIAALVDALPQSVDQTAGSHSCSRPSRSEAP